MRDKTSPIDRVIIPGRARRRAIRKQVSVTCQTVREHDFRLIGSRMVDLSAEGMLVLAEDSAKIGDELIVRIADLLCAPLLPDGALAARITVNAPVSVRHSLSVARQALDPEHPSRAFLHQITLGQPFVEHAWARALWIGLYVVTFGALLLFRVASPLWRSWRHALRVHAVVQESPDTVSVWVRGRGLSALRVHGGQFFGWRFLTRELWWQSHPYSVSAGSDDTYLRITVKDLGDHSSSLRRMKVGTRVLAEGPYGVFHAGSRQTDKVAAFAAGVGVTPIRAVLDDLPDGTSVTLIYRVAERATAPLHEELEAMVSERGWRMHYLQGPRRHHPLTAEYLTHLAPGIAAADVFVCGPDSFTESIVEAAEAAGVPQDRIHHEAFAF
mgnify:CR=1 FL=1